MRAFVFPGQGSQVVGMGKMLASNFQVAQHVFQEVDETLKQSLFKLMAEGPEDELRLTYNAQPALMAVSMAVVRVLEKESGKSLAELCDFVAGHSLGEYTAYAATGVFDLATTATLLKARGNLMAEAVPTGIGGMAALLGADLAQAEQLTQKVSKPDAVCEVANDNAPGQIVVSGHIRALEALTQEAPAFGIKRVIMLPVSGPFHSSLMEPAAKGMAQVLEATTLTKMPSVSVVPNVLATRLEQLDQLKPALVAQITGRVRWTETIRFLKTQGITEVVELGSGKVLCGLCKRIEADLPCSNIENPQDVGIFLAGLTA